MLTPMALLHILLTMLQEGDSQKAITTIIAYLEQHASDSSKVFARQEELIPPLVALQEALKPLVTECPNFTAIFKLTDSTIGYIRPYIPETNDHAPAPDPSPQHYH